MSHNSKQEWFRANGFYGGAMTTMRQKSIRTVYYNQIEGDLAHCSVFDMHNNILILDEAVINGGRYKISRYGEYIYLDNQGTSIDTRQTDTYSTKSGMATMPSAIELSGTTTENYWKDYQLLGMYNIHGTRNGAPSYKRARNAFILGRDRWNKSRFHDRVVINQRSTDPFSGEIYFWYVSRCSHGENEWIVTSKKEFDENKNCPSRWLWKKSQGIAYTK